MAPGHAADVAEGTPDVEVKAADWAARVADVADGDDVGVAGGAVVGRGAVNVEFVGEDVVGAPGRTLGADGVSARLPSIVGESGRTLGAVGVSERLPSVVGVSGRTPGADVSGRAPGAADVHETAPGAAGVPERVPGVSGSVGVADVADWPGAAGAADWPGGRVAAGRVTAGRCSGPPRRSRARSGPAAGGPPAAEDPPLRREAPPPGSPAPAAAAAAPGQNTGTHGLTRDSHCWDTVSARLKEISRVAFHTA